MGWLHDTSNDERIETIRPNTAWKHAKGETHEERLAKIAAHQAAVESAAASVAVGDPMAVPSGAFAGWEGTVVSVSPLTVRVVVFGKEHDHVV